MQVVADLLPLLACQVYELVDHLLLCNLELGFLGSKELKVKVVFSQTCKNVIAETSPWSAALQIGSAQGSGFVSSA